MSVFVLDTSALDIVAVSIAEMARALLNMGWDVDAARSFSLAYANLATSVVPVDAALPARAFEVGSACGSRLPLVDAFIAAGASLLDATLVHRDAHSSEIPGGLLTQELLE
jgi:predicted nucleic acid-binding protein